MSPIIGRQRELATLETARLTERLVTLTGVGGIGKTRLAIELATRTAGRDKFGPYFVDLAPISDVELVPAALAAALGVPRRTECRRDDARSVRARRSLRGRRSRQLRTPPTRRSPNWSAPCSPRVPRLRMVATSREPLGVAGERVCPVDPLRVPPAAASIEEIEASDAGALFLARLPMNLTTGPLSTDEVAAVGTICRSLDGIPLGLELAAAHSRTLSLPELADRLDRSISELAPPRHGVTPRHRTMRAALDWGYQLLTPICPGCPSGDERVRRGLRPPGILHHLPRRRGTGGRRRARRARTHLLRHGRLHRCADPLPAARTRPPIRPSSPRRQRRHRRPAPASPLPLPGRSHRPDARRRRSRPTQVRRPEA